MKIANISAYSSVNNKAFGFKGNDKPQKQEYYNPVNVKTEKKLAVLSSSAISAGVGVIAGATTALLSNKSSKKIPLLVGAAAGLLTLGLSLPSKLYHTNVNATVKQKEMDVFTADRELKKDLTQNVHEEVQDPEVSLDKKLDDNLKLQLANRAAMVGFKTV